MVGLGLCFQNSGLDLDRKMWQSAHLWHVAVDCIALNYLGMHKRKMAIRGI